jgi:TonB family protein
MKNPRRLLALFALAAVAGLPAFAVWEPARPLNDNREPVYPPALVLQGITKGRVIVAVSVDADGRVKEQLPLAYTHPMLAHAATEALREWRYKPARLDGDAVPVQFELNFDFSLQGAVITANIVNHFLYDGFTNAGDNALTYQPARPRQLDRAPVRVSGEDPKFATAAAQQGVIGQVTVKFYIDEQGNVRLPAVNKEAHPYLVEQAIAAVRTWKFEPATTKGRPVLIAARQDFNFSR